jgi:ATP-binding cassette subfamily C exporter for protease/lipase
VREIKAKGKTVFLISHRPGVVAVADRLLVLRNGVVQAAGPRDAVLDAMQVARAAASSGQPPERAAPALSGPA